MRLPREKGSSTHNPGDPLCVRWNEDEAWSGSVCGVCHPEDDREKARYFLDHAPRELGT